MANKAMKTKTIYLANQREEILSDFLHPKENSEGYYEAKPSFDSVKEIKSLQAFCFWEDLDNPFKLELKPEVSKKTGKPYLSGRKDFESDGRKFFFMVNVTKIGKNKKKILYATTFLFKAFPESLDKKFLGVR